MAEKTPYINLFVNDWLADAALRVCSLEARGLWIDMLCMMRQSDRPGFLMTGSKQTTDAQLARAVGVSEDDVFHLLTELEESGVFSRDESGTIFCRRMVRECRLSDQRAEAGRLGAQTTNSGKRPANVRQSGRQTSSKPPSKMPATSGNGIGGGNGSEKGGVGEKPSDADSLIISLISRMPGRQSKREELASLLDSTAQVLTLWADVSADDTVKHPVSVMAARAASGGLSELNPLTTACVISAVKSGLVHVINDIDVTNAKLTHNAEFGLYINGELAVPSAQLAEAVYA